MRESLDELNACGVCNEKDAVTIVLPKKAEHKPVYCCMECVKDYPNVYYDGPLEF